MIAYFSMEIGLDAAMPTYAGGLGVLAGDTIRAAADLNLEMVAVTLLHRKGYFRQKLSDDGWQVEEPAEWAVEQCLVEMPERISVTIENRNVSLRAWRYTVEGASGFGNHAFLLDANLPENSEWDRTLTNCLYGGDQRYRLCQEAILGIGGVRMLRALGYTAVERFHLNEGHASLLVLELLDEEVRRSGGGYIRKEHVEAVRKLCVFTTHTPVAAGHDQFPMDLVTSVLGRKEVYEMKDVFCCDGVLNMTFLALNLSHYVNGVAKRHGEISRHMFARYRVDSITNGVHAATWTSPPFANLFDRHVPGWRLDNFSLRYAMSIPREEIRLAHRIAKQALFDHVKTLGGPVLDPNVFTIGFARRATSYKRADLFFRNPDRLRQIARSVGRFHIVFAGKAHPHDQGGKEIIHEIFTLKELLRNDVTVLYLNEYDMRLGKLMTAGVDLWLNTPQPPLEASGTSGMKAALNGVPSLSVLDGWWIEGCIEDITGWSIGAPWRDLDSAPNSQAEAAALYDKLESTILPLFYGRPDEFVETMRHAIALNGSFFNTHRMIQQYVLNAYFR